MLSTVQAKLLIVDDLPENLLALEALIKREDRQVFKALSADEALSLLLEHEFAMAIDVGVLDLDDIAYDLGFSDFADMDISISPKALADRDATNFITAVRNFALAGSNMSDEEILTAAGSSAPSQTHGGM